MSIELQDMVWSLKQRLDLTNISMKVSAIKILVLTTIKILKWLGGCRGHNLHKKSKLYTNASLELVQGGMDLGFSNFIDFCILGEGLLTKRNKMMNFDMMGALGKQVEHCSKYVLLLPSLTTEIYSGENCEQT